MGRPVTAKKFTVRLTESEGRAVLSALVDALNPRADRYTAKERQALERVLFRIHGTRPEDLT